MRNPLPRPLMLPMPRHRVADSSCTAFVGDSRQRLRTPSEATVHQPALCGHKFGHCGVRCCGGSPASRGCGARHTQHPLSAPPSNPSFAAAAKCAWQHVLTTAGANYSLLLHPSPAAAAARLRARGLLASLPPPLASTAPPTLLLLRLRGSGAGAESLLSLALLLALFLLVAAGRICRGTGGSRASAV